MDWNELPQEYRDLEETFNKKKVNLNTNVNSIAIRFAWDYTPQYHEFWEKCYLAKTIKELPRIPKDIKTIKQDVIDNYTFDEFVSKLDEEVDPKGLKHCYESYKEFLSNEFSDFTIEEILLFNKYRGRLERIYEWTHSNLYMKMLEFEQRKN